MTLRLSALLLLVAFLAACGAGGSTTATPPSATGSSPSAAGSPGGTQTALPSGTVGQGAAWPTYHGDPGRSGVGTGPRNFSKVAQAWQSPSLDGDVYAEPLIANGLVVVATENNVVAAFDAGSGAQRWSVRLGNPVPASSLPCGDIRPVSGITGTPVIDAANGAVYVVAFLQPGRHELYALDLATGAVRFHRPIDPPGADPLTLQQRGALAVANGRVFVAYGGLYGDCGDYHGWVVGAAADGSGNLVTYQVPSGRAAGIWSPAGIVVDASGNLWVATGNSFSGKTYDMNDAVIELSPTLGVEGYWAPADWLALNRGDTDLGSVAPTLLGQGLVLAVGKSGIAYVLDRSHLGGAGAQPAASQKVCAAAFGGTAVAGSMVYIPCTDGLVAVQVGSGPSLSVAWRQAAGFAEPPIIAAGAAWFVDRNAHTLVAVDERTGQVLARESLGATTHFTTPAASGDEVFVVAGGRLVAFRLS